MPAFVLVLATWAGTGLYLLVTGIGSGRRALALGRARQALGTIEIPDTNEVGLRTAVVSLVSALPEDVVLPLGRLVHLASGAGPGAGGRRHRALRPRLARSHRRHASHAEAQLAAHRGHARARSRLVAGIACQPAAARHSMTPIRRSSARAWRVLGRIPDMAAAAALVDALKQGKYAPSRDRDVPGSVPAADRRPAPPAARAIPTRTRATGAPRCCRATRARASRPISCSSAQDPSPLVRKAAVTSLSQIDRASTGPGRTRAAWRCRLVRPGARGSRTGLRRAAPKPPGRSRRC